MKRPEARREAPGLSFWLFLRHIFKYLTIFYIRVYYFQTLGQFSSNEKPFSHMQKLQKYRAWFGLDRAVKVVAAFALLMMMPSVSFASTGQAASAERQQITRSMTGAPDDVGWRQNMTNGVKTNLNKSYDVDKVVTGAVQMNFYKNSVNVAHGPDLRAVTSDHPRSAYVPYSYTLEKNPFSLIEEQEMRQLATVDDRSWCPGSMCPTENRMSFSACDNSTASVSMWPLSVAYVSRE